ncbi:glucose/arabinose dehydrogenase [Archangium gephyra]|uniref:Glucose/arabinose dehydrogenase n=1 Tax=Archangium gephyra TaxID=48 RepID=A0ABX9K5T1_9BACT|nr:PQQ-dependent sugar dehydrogenase [Archangium gephyra]REG34169.1 glucose/arabinose dehydrogenase [Archangium gephyra]
MRLEALRALACLLLLWGCTEVEQPPGSPPRQRAEAAAVPTRFTDTLVTEGLDTATSMTIAPDGRIFVCEQDGRLRLIQDGKLLSAPFLTVDTDDSGERGLLGVALDPDFPRQPYVYVYYTATTPQVHNRVSRFTANGNLAVPGSERILFELEPLGASNHNGGALHFGPGGKLFVAVGENTRSDRAPRLDSLLGKVLRLEKDGTVPTDNPFYTRTTGSYRAIWAIGLRNPYSLAVQPGTGRLFINDVGAGDWEEINEGLAGAHYGWPDTEGPTTDSRFRTPLFAYRHGSGTSGGCAITAGVFYNPAQRQFPTEYTGRYFFSDYCNGWIRTYDPKDGAVAVFATGLDAPVDLDVGPDGSLYYLDRADDSVRRIRYTASNEAPTLTSQPASLTVAPGQPATFTVGASGTPTLRYQWLRNDTELAGQTSPSLTLPPVKLSDSGARFRVRVSNDYGSVLSNEVTLTVRSNTAPVATLLLPVDGALYSAGDVITYEGRGTDAEDGTLPDSAFTWSVDFHHDEHLHPFVPATRGARSGRFTVPERGETAANVWYRIHLRVEDSSGAVHELFRDVRPRKVKLRMDTEPAGLRVTLDGQPQPTPLEVETVAGVVRALGAVSPQEKDGKTYVFERWSHGGGESQEVRPTVDSRYTAVFREESAPGNGLRARYFDTADFKELKLERVDPTVDFRWESGSPDPAVDLNTFSVRWTGSVVPLYSETYTFYTQSNDGVRLWVDGMLLIDNWTVHSTTENRGTVTLQAGRAHALQLEFFEQTGLATMRLHWSSPSQRKQIIPPAQLRPASP